MQITATGADYKAIMDAQAAELADARLKIRILTRMVALPRPGL